MKIAIVDAAKVYADLVIGSDTLQPDDRARLFEIFTMDQPYEFAAALRAYYGDADRADRTPRGILYFHIGLLCGTVARETDGEA